MLKDKTIILGVTGSIAAYKAADVASLLVKNGAIVHVIMTKNATNIINPIAFETLTGNKCLVDTFDRNFQFNVAHVSLAKKADCFVVAPASANFLAKAANGIADDMLSTTFLAAACPKIVFPAMNTQMLLNPVTQANIETCRSFGIQVEESAEGRLACGDTGRGKLPSPSQIFDSIFQKIAYKKDFLGKKIVVSAGPTREAIDPVRFISNRSTGKMGYAIAKVASARGADVTLVSGPVALEVPPFVRFVGVESARQMFDVIRSEAENADVVIKAAAVADFRPIEVASEKIKKSGENSKIDLERTDDILAWLGEHKKNQILCGFSMETQNLLENSRKKLQKKNLDLIVANNLRTQGAGFGTESNVVTLIGADFEIELPILPKIQVASRILDEIAKKL